MSDRRQARAGAVTSVVTGAGGVPRCLLIGRCLEVWTAEALLASRSGDLHLSQVHSANRRFTQARAWWMAQAGVSDRDSWQLIPAGAPWSTEYLRTHGRAEAVASRLARSRVKVRDLPALRSEAEHLYAMATGPD